MDNKPPSLAKRLIKNNIFRLSLLYTLLFFIASLAMLGVAYITIEKNIEASIEKEVNGEIARFIGSYQSNALGIKTEPYAFFVEHEGRKLAGNLSALPEDAQVALKKQEEAYKEEVYQDALKWGPPPPELLKIAGNKVDGEENYWKKGKIFGKTVALPNQTTVFIGKSSYDATERRKDIIDALTTALMALVVFGFFGGMMISFQSIKRIDRISRVSQSIMGGNLDLRIPRSKQKDDIADLGRNINKMLDRINILMQNTREVTNNIAHDLRTPLTRLRANIETIARKSEGDIQAEAHQALAETDNLLNTFSSLLRISQVESGTAKILKNPIDLSQLSREILDFYGLLAVEKSQSLRLNIAEKITIIGDKTLLSQAIVNLFTNAVKYTPEKGNISISLNTINKNQIAELIIHDSGMGVPEAEIDKLTERFYRLERHRDTANGNGLGLAMVKAIIDAHNGELLFVNDIGLKVIVHLPIQQSRTVNWFI